MRERDDIPEWALNQVRGHLRRGEEIINAIALKAGTKNVVLLNTSKGAALVVKGILGDPDSVVLGFPRDLMTYRCTTCASRNVVIDVTPPHDVHCSHCGQRQHLVRAGEVRELGVRSTRGPPARRATRTAPKPGAKAKTATRRPSKRSGTTTKAARKKKTAKKKAAKKKTAKKKTRRSAPSARSRTKAAATSKYRPQCLALTPDDAQCRNSARAGSKYCAAHKQYHPPAAKRARAAKDTLPRVRGAKDTAPSGRKRASKRSGGRKAKAASSAR